MKKHKVTLIETSDLNDIREGDIYVSIDNETGLIKEMMKRTNGSMVSMLYSKPEEQTEVEEVYPDVEQQEVIEDIPASKDTLVKPLKIE